MTQRAIALEDKAARRADILAAARKLFLQDTRQLPAVARIAEAAGLAKGTVYLYFRTKEEIFVALLSDEWAGLLADVEAAFAEGTQDVDGFIRRYMAYLDAHPELLRLDAMAYSVLEKNLEDAILRQFKLNLLQQLQQTGAVVEQTIGLPPGRGVVLLSRCYALTRGLWQSHDHPPQLQALLAEPQFAPLRNDFHSELPAALREYWRGALLGD